MSPVAGTGPGTGRHPEGQPQSGLRLLASPAAAEISGWAGPGDAATWPWPIGFPLGQAPGPRLEERRQLRSAPRRAPCVCAPRPGREAEPATEPGSVTAHWRHGRPVTVRY